MRYFPQLETRTAGQYPLRRERHERVVKHEAADGRVFSLYDGNAARVEWVLRYEGLTDGERGAIDALFATCEGRLRSFVFVDPAANLLLWSEDYGRSAWTQGAMLTATSGQSDGWGTMRATRLTNTGSAAQSLSQTIAAPGQLHYCFSVFAAGAGQRFRMRIDGGGAVIEREFTASEDWRRYSVAGKPDTAAETVTFSVTLQPGQSVLVTGAQVDAQPAPGGYRPTTSRRGIYPNARFAEDELAWTQQAPNNNAAEIRIESRP
jgi:hypothetical protein